MLQIRGLLAILLWIAVATVIGSHRTLPERTTNLVFHSLLSEVKEPLGSTGVFDTIQAAENKDGRTQRKAEKTEEIKLAVEESDSIEEVLHAAEEVV